jgi:hypothetical protein
LGVPVYWHSVGLQGGSLQPYGRGRKEQYPHILAAPTLLLNQGDNEALFVRAMVVEAQGGRVTLPGTMLKPGCVGRFSNTEFKPIH